MARLYVCGEALIDFVPTPTGPGEMGFLPKTGGSPYNAARAARVAGADVSFVGAFSDDMFGDQLRADLAAVGVDLSLAPVAPHPTTLAFVDTSGGSPRYAFFNEGTATRMTTLAADVLQPNPGDILDVGSISLIDLPGADDIVALCRAMAGRMRISLDPNARPGMTEDKAAWVARIEAISAVATVIKISDEDLDYLYPGLSADAYAAKLFEGATELVIVTRGPDGAEAFTPKTHAAAPAPVIEVVDTVGAGDTLMGTMLAWLLEVCPEGAAPICDLTADQLRAMLTFGATAAAINCTRVGASPPSRAEIDAAVARGHV